MDTAEEYFGDVNLQLKQYKRTIPALLIDLDRLDHNLGVLNKSLQAKTHFRIVVKSLPSYELVQYVMERSNSSRLMVFHQPFLSDLSGLLDQKVDILLGKPMPIKTARYYFENIPDNPRFDPYKQIQWLMDTSLRIEEYIALAKQLGRKIRLNLEIDVGLHRGGFGDLEGLKKALSLIRENQEYVIFSGFMGYDPHVVKLPKFILSEDQAFAKACQYYKDCIELLQNNYPELNREDLTFNGGGSPTLSLHNTDQSPINDLSAGSCLLMPTDFDIPSLTKFIPACYIATPVLKIQSKTNLPGLKPNSWLKRLINGKDLPAAFIYGGYWKADFCYPAGTKVNKLYGQSTNQSMVNFPIFRQLKVDDHVFLRPRQSESVLLQFGVLLVLRGRKIQREWSLLRNC